MRCKKIFLVALLGCVIGCVHTEKNLQIHADSLINSNEIENDTPVLVRFYQLESPNGFISSRYKDLANKVKLKGVLDTEELIVKPKETIALDMHMHADAKYVGVFVDYKNPKGKQYKTLRKKPRWLRPVKIHLCKKGIID